MLMLSKSRRQEGSAQHNDAHQRSGGELLHAGLLVPKNFLGMKTPRIQEGIRWGILVYDRTEVKGSRLHTRSLQCQHAANGRPMDDRQLGSDAKSVVGKMPEATSSVCYYDPALDRGGAAGEFCAGVAGEPGRSACRVEIRIASSCGLATC